MFWKIVIIWCVGIILGRNLTSLLLYFLRIQSCWKFLILWSLYHCCIKIYLFWWKHCIKFWVYARKVEFFLFSCRRLNLIRNWCWLLFLNLLFLLFFGDLSLFGDLCKETIELFFELISFFLLRNFRVSKAGQWRRTFGFIYRIHKFDY